jgi:hypothetical protein
MFSLTLYAVATVLTLCASSHVLKSAMLVKVTSGVGVGVDAVGVGVDVVGVGVVVTGVVGVPPPPPPPPAPPLSQAANENPITATSAIIPKSLIIFFMKNPFCHDHPRGD